MKISRTWTLTIDIPGTDEKVEGVQICKLVLPRGHLVVGHRFPVLADDGGRHPFIIANVKLTNNYYIYFLGDLIVLGV